MQTVKDILKKKGRNLFTIPPGKSVLEALRLMAEKNIGAVLVMEQGGRLEGIFSERDYARKIILMDRRSDSTPVGEVMTRQVMCVDITQSVEACMALMTEKHIRHLPVFEGNELAGIISIGDVVKSTIEEKDFLIEQLEHYIAGSL